MDWVGQYLKAELRPKNDDELIKKVKGIFINYFTQYDTSEAVHECKSYLQSIDDDGKRFKELIQIIKSKDRILGSLLDK